MITEGIEEFPNGLDPASNHDPEEIRIYANIYESLVSLSADYQTIMPNLARSWEISEDKLSYTFHLRAGIYFHDGSPLSAQAVVASFRRQVGLNPYDPLFDMIDSILPLDSLTLEIRLKYPYAQFLYALTSAVGLKVISEQALEKWGDDITFHPVGTGPFTLKSRKEDKEIFLTTFSGYRENGPVRGIVYRCVENYFGREELFKQGKLDIHIGIPGYSIDRLRWLGKVGYKTLPPTSTVFLGFNCRSPVFSDPAIRKAVLKAFDIPRIVNNLLRGNSLAARGPLPPGFFDYQDLQQQGYHPEQSRYLLEQAGYRQGLTLSLYYLDRFRARNTPIEIIRHSLGKVNIDLKLVPFYSWDSFNAACKSDSAQMFLTVWDSDLLGDAENFLYSLFYSRSQFNFMNYENQRVDQWLDAARREADREKRQLLYREIVRQVLKDTPAVFLYHVIPVFAYNRGRIPDLPVNPYGMIQYHLIRFNE